VREDQMAPGMGPGPGMMQPPPDMRGGGRGMDFNKPPPPGAVVREPSGAFRPLHAVA
jgi:hypothetical protein